MWPFLGNIPKILGYFELQKRLGTNYHPGKHAYDEMYKKEGYSGTTGVAILMVTDKPLLQIHNPKIVEALYTTKNKFFDKHPLVKDLTNCLTGDSILFAETTKQWSNSRKAISPAFYKSKLIQMIDIARVAMRKTHKQFAAVIDKSGGPRATIDIIDHVLQMTSRILLMCALGEDISDEVIDFWENGKLVKKSMNLALKDTFGFLVNRIADPHVVLFPFLADRFILPYERCHMKNA